MTKPFAAGFLVALLAASLFSGCHSSSRGVGARSSPFGLVPFPRELVLREGRGEISARSRILYDSREAQSPIERSLRAHAEVLAGEIELLTGMKLPVLPLSRSGEGEGKTREGDVVLRFLKVPPELMKSEEDQDQSYELEVGDSIEIASPYFKGVAYGTATLLQALTPTVEGAVVPWMSIRDEPLAAYRAVMVDVARRPHSLGTLKEVVRLARLYKLRYVHLHLTDNQNFTFPFSPVTDHVENNATFTREELCDLVSYADARGVTLIPELDLPGHSSILRKSGYLDPSETDADVAAPENAERINAIIDSMCEVFESSPYFHIGGDESRAGAALIPFLERVQVHLRSKREGEKRRLMVWEGFRGTPRGLPARGKDRVVVLSWESSYNPPWSLLEAGYSIVNASWKPLYLVGRGTPRHPGASTRMWSPEVLFSWDKDTLMHWEPGRPVFEDAGPNDPDLDDGVWRTSYIGAEDQVIGGQLLLWEQEEQWVIQDLLSRLPVVAARLWNPETPESFQEFEAAAARVLDRVLPIVRPVEILPETVYPTSPASLDFRLYRGDSVEVTLRNRTRVSGSIRYNLGAVSDDVTFVRSERIPAVTVQSNLYEGPFSRSGGFGVRAKLFREDGRPVEGTEWQAFQNWGLRVRVTDFDFGRRALKRVPDLTKHGDKAVRTYDLPMLRGPYTHTDCRAQKLDAVLNIPETGRYTLSAKTQHGRATVYLDRDRDGSWDPEDLILRETSRDERPQSLLLELEAGDYRLRVDHAAALPRPVLILMLEGPGVKRQEITPFLSLPPG